MTGWVAKIVVLLVVAICDYIFILSDVISLSPPAAIFGVAPQSSVPKILNGKHAAIWLAATYKELYANIQKYDY